MPIWLLVGIAIAVAIGVAYFLFEGFRQKVASAASTLKSKVTGGSSTGGSTTPPPSSKTTNVSVKASDPSDIYARTWSIFTADPGAYQGGGQYGTSAAAEEDHTSGDSMSVTVPSASAMWFTATQSGGSNFGSYAGTITVNGNTISFDGVDASHPFKFIP